MNEIGALYFILLFGACILLPIIAAFIGKKYIDYFGDEAKRQGITFNKKSMANINFSLFLKKELIDKLKEIDSKKFNSFKRTRIITISTGILLLLFILFGALMLSHH